MAISLQAMFTILKHLSTITFIDTKMRQRIHVIEDKERPDDNMA
jgi:hypothetical protein